MTRSLARSKFAHPLITAAAATQHRQSGQRQAEQAAPPTARVTAIANSTQPMTR